MNQKGIDKSAIGDAFYSNLLRVRNSMIYEGLLENLEHVDSTDYKWETETIFVYIEKKSNKQISESEYYYLKAHTPNIDELVDVKKYEINGTEMDAVFKSGDKIISYPIGEMILINNKWSMFTKAGVDYYVK